MSGLQTIPGCCCGECKEHTCECCQCACVCICVTVTLSGTGTGSGVFPETVCWNATNQQWEGPLESLDNMEVQVRIRRDPTDLQCYLYLDMSNGGTGTGDIYRVAVAAARDCNPTATFTGVDVSGYSSTHSSATINIACQRRVELSPACACASLCFGRVHLDALLVSTASPADCTQAITLTLIEGSDPPCWYWPGPISMSNNTEPTDPGTATWSWADMLMSWVLITNSCHPDCTPVEPSSPGTIDGETQITTCSCPAVDCGVCEDNTGTADEGGITICCVPESTTGTGTGTGTVGSLPLIQRYLINGQYFDTLFCNPDTAPIGTKYALTVGDCEVDVIIAGWADCNI